MASITPETYRKLIKAIKGEATADRKRWYRTLVGSDPDKESRQVQDKLKAALGDLYEGDKPDQFENADRRPKIKGQTRGRVASFECEWIDHASVASKALECLSEWMATNDIEKIWSNSSNRPTKLEIIQGFYEYTWICLSRGCKEKDNICPKNMKRPPKDVHKSDISAWYASESRRAVGIIKARWEDGEPLREIINRWWN
ncbi:hypothetical protein VFPPC_04349 [Pochonia chlamydosporia 170]|uniref:Uncharacterized protein n=1 Tax=Pochonia chlamydosporia 170 TaxID=1380566 RepID=A0A179FR19_METCM|nr:hypothetical protein VFPPC_04349 [Pochonia chlamydosporia 170]OAQ68042.1 hypothetical protein VFPPC_04349 [Pochonia chlamydosporia 170]